METGRVWVIGALASRDGSFLKRGSDGPSVVGFVPANSYCDEQPGDVPVCLGHDGRIIGTVAYLERSRDTLWAIAEVDAAAVPDTGPLFWSAGITVAADVRESFGAEAWLRTGGARLRHAALVAEPAAVHVGAVTIVDDLADWPVGNDHVRPVALRARAAIRARPFRASWERSAPSLHVVDPELDPVLERAAVAAADEIREAIAEVDALLDGPGRAMAADRYGRTPLRRVTGVVLG